MRTEVHEITVKKAKEFLAHNNQFERGKEDTNRPINPRKVNLYAVDMLKGNWRLTHQGIAFSKSGWMKDGQHRMLAIVQAGETGATDGSVQLPPKPTIKIKMPVTFGLDEDVFDVIDNGLPRNANQILAMAGYRNGVALAACARLLYMYDNYDYKLWGSARVSNHEVLTTVRQTNIDAYIPESTGLVPYGFMIIPTTVGYYVCERAYPSGPHEEFLEVLRSGVDAGKDDPRIVFRNMVIRSKGQARIRRRESTIHLAYYIKTWNDFVAGVKRNAISFRAGEEFPKPIEK